MSDRNFLRSEHDTNSCHVRLYDWPDPYLFCKLPNTYTIIQKHPSITSKPRLKVGNTVSNPNPLILFRDFPFPNIFNVSEKVYMRRYPIWINDDLFKHTLQPTITIFVNMLFNYKNKFLIFYIIYRIYFPNENIKLSMRIKFCQLLKYYFYNTFAIKYIWCKYFFTSPYDISSFACV